MVKLGFSLQASYGIPNERVMELLKNEGFSAISPVWTPQLPLKELSDAAQKHGMVIQSLHSPHGEKACLWEPQHPQSAEIEESILRCIDDCARFRVGVMVLHGWEGFHYTFREENLYFSVFDRIVAHAKEKGVAIAFENLEGEEYLHALMARYRNRPHIGFCWDSGHDRCYPHKNDCLQAFGQRLIMTHLNDNRGLRSADGSFDAADDLHFLPYDGTADWEQLVSRLKDHPRQEILNFEIKKRSFSTKADDLIYDGLSPEEFFRLAGQRCRQIGKLYEDVMENLR
jgi:sugar phosphate isomerase/epimerase